MNQDTAREDIAFIRQTIEQGRRLVGTWSPDMAVWGVAVAIGYFGSYASARRLWSVDSDWLWTACIVLPWAYSLRRLARRLFAGHADVAAPAPTASALSMLWFACGVCLTILGFAVILAGEPRHNWWINAVAAGVMGIGFFASSFLCNLAWMRWVAVGWWAGELGSYALGNRAEALLLSGALMLVLLAAPGFLMMRERRP